MDCSRSAVLLQEGQLRLMYGPHGMLLASANWLKVTVQLLDIPPPAVSPTNMSTDMLAGQSVIPVILTHDTSDVWLGNVVSVLEAVQHQRCHAGDRLLQ